MNSQHEASDKQYEAGKPQTGACPEDEALVTVRNGQTNDTANRVTDEHRRDAKTD